MKRYCLLCLAALAAAGCTNPTVAYTMDLTQPVEPAQVLDLGGAATNPQGHALTVTGRSLVLDGEPWLPVMGEFHFARYPESQWRDELLKIKAGGIDVLASYVFWIHHEEIEGQFDWSGRRSLRSLRKPFTPE